MDVTSLVRRTSKSPHAEGTSHGNDDTEDEEDEEGEEDEEVF